MPKSCVLMKDGEVDLTGLGDMFRGFGNIASAVRQAQQLGDRMQEVNTQLRGQRVTAESGAGLVQVDANGLSEILQVRIDPSLLKDSEREVLEDLLAAAVNQAWAKAKQLHVDAVKSMATGLDVPGLSDALNEVTGNAGEET
jgi:DNA-binding YbaB/EbfC family protein